MPASSSRAKSSVRFGGACSATSGGRISRATAIVQSSSSSGGSGASAIRVPALARKFWTITSWTCGPAAAIASSASIRSSRVSPIPIRIPVVNGTRASPASRSVSRRAAGQLVGRAEVRPAARREPVGGRLEHHPHRGGDRPQQLEVGGGEHARVEVRQERGLLEHGARRLGEVLDRRAEAERRELLARRPVAQLGLVAEREERLAAAGALAGARDLEHLVDGQVGALAAARRARERAVVADVAAELRQRDEDLRAVGDERPGARLAHGARLGHQLVERAVRELHRVIVVTAPVLHPLLRARARRRRTASSSGRARTSARPPRPGTRRPSASRVLPSNCPSRWRR